MQAWPPSKFSRIISTSQSTCSVSYWS